MRAALRHAGLFHHLGKPYPLRLRGKKLEDSETVPGKRTDRFCYSMQSSFSSIRLHTSSAGIASTSDRRAIGGRSCAINYDDQIMHELQMFDAYSRVAALRMQSIF